MRSAENADDVTKSVSLCDVPSKKIGSKGFGGKGPVANRAFPSNRMPRRDLGQALSGESSDHSMLNLKIGVAIKSDRAQTVDLQGSSSPMSLRIWYLQSVLHGPDRT